MCISGQWSDPSAFIVVGRLFHCLYLYKLKSSSVCTLWNAFMLNKISKSSCKERFHSNYRIRAPGKLHLNFSSTSVTQRNLKIGFQPFLFFNMHFQICLNNTNIKAYWLWVKVCSCQSLAAKRTSTLTSQCPGQDTSTFRGLEGGTG